MNASSKLLNVNVIHLHTKAVHAGSSISIMTSQKIWNGVTNKDKHFRAWSSQSIKWELFSPSKALTYSKMFFYLSSGDTCLTTIQDIQSLKLVFNVGYSWNVWQVNLYEFRNMSKKVWMSQDGASLKHVRWTLPCTNDTFLASVLFT